MGIDVVFGIAAALFGLAFVAIGLSYYLMCSPDQRRRFIRDNANIPERPRLHRNAPFLAIPMGVWFLVESAFLLDLIPSFQNALVVIGLGGLVGNILLFGLLPDWAKPGWVREQERAGFPLAREPNGQG